MHKTFIIIVLFMLLLPAGRAYNGASLPIQIELTAASEAPILPIEPTKKVKKERHGIRRLVPRQLRSNDEGAWVVVVYILAWLLVIAALVLLPVGYYHAISWMITGALIVLSLLVLFGLSILFSGLDDGGELSKAVGFFAWYAIILALLIEFIIIMTMAWLPFFWYILGAFVFALVLPILLNLL